MQRFRFTFVEVLIGIAIVGIIVSLVVGMAGEAKEKRAFMAECRGDHKQYECDAMWYAIHPPYNGGYDSRHRR